MTEYIDVLFDRHPATPSGECRFIEVENNKGESIRAGEWVEREDGMWALRIPSMEQRVAEQIADWLEAQDRIGRSDLPWPQNELVENIVDAIRNTEWRNE
jgi:hypothetical protein